MYLLIGFGTSANCWFQGQKQKGWNLQEAMRLCITHKPPRVPIHRAYNLLVLNVGNEGLGWLFIGTYYIRSFPHSLQIASKTVLSFNPLKMAPSTNPPNLAILDDFSNETTVFIAIFASEGRYWDTYYTYIATSKKLQKKIYGTNLVICYFLYLSISTLW